MHKIKEALPGDGQIKHKVVGLKTEAHKWVEENCEKEGVDKCPHCGKMTKQMLRSDTVGQSKHGMFDDGPELDRYYGKGSYKGWVVEEVDDKCEWSSGPVIFLCLELTDPSGVKARMFEWSPSEIEKNL